MAQVIATFHSKDATFPTVSRLKLLNVTVFSTDSADENFGEPLFVSSEKVKNFVMKIRKVVFQKLGKLKNIHNFMYCIYYPDTVLKKIDFFF